MSVLWSDHTLPFTASRGHRNRLCKATTTATVPLSLHLSLHLSLLRQAWYSDARGSACSNKLHTSTLPLTDLLAKVDSSQSRPSTFSLLLAESARIMVGPSVHQAKSGSPVGCPLNYRHFAHIDCLRSSIDLGL